MLTERVAYRSWMSDNSRWDALELRAGDVVISTPPKSGTTWTQRLVSLLVFDGPELPGPLAMLSPWLDLTAMPVEHVVAALDAQTHRRFIKTHTPLDGLDLDPRVTYLVVGRDPRDAAVSMLVDQDRLYALEEATRAGGRPPHPGHPPPHPPGHPRPPVPPHRPGLKPPPQNPLEEMRVWLERPVMATEGIVSLATILHHYEIAWSRRQLPNVALFHFGDFRADLIGEFGRLADVLGIDATRTRLEELAAHATLEAMKSRAAELSPELWVSPEPFFREGGPRDWAAIVGDAERELYRRRGTEWASPEVWAWAHHGRGGADPA
jgi:aryl sulfotransferase